MRFSFSIPGSFPSREALHVVCPRLERGSIEEKENAWGIRGRRARAGLERLARSGSS